MNRSSAWLWKDGYAAYAEDLPPVPDDFATDASSPVLLERLELDISGLVEPDLALETLLPVPEAREFPLSDVGALLLSSLPVADWLSAKDCGVNRPTDPTFSLALLLAEEREAELLLSDIAGYYVLKALVVWTKG